MSEKDRPDLDLNTRLGIVKTASNTIERCRTFWNSRLPLTQENLPEVRATLEDISKALYTIKELPIVSGSSFKKERMQYFNSVLSIPKSYIEDVNRLEKNKWYYKISRPSMGNGTTESDIFLAEYMLTIAGINDMCMGVIRSEQVRNRDFDLKKLNQDALERVKMWHGYSTKGEEIPNKTSRNIAEGTWSIFWLMNPITDIDDKNVLYEKIAIGNFKSWSACYQRRLTELKYMEKVRNQWYERWKDPELRSRLLQYRRGWVSQLCYPEQLLILAAPELHIAFTGSNLEQDKQRTTYIS